jgi:cell division transport system permease protein
MGANRLMSFASVGVLTACFIITGVALLLWANIDRVADFLSGQSEITVVLLEEIEADEQAAIVGESIRALPNVDEVVYMSKDDVFLDLKRMMGEMADLLDGYERVLPARFKVTVKDLTMIEMTNSQLAAIPGVEKTMLQGDLADVLVTIENGVTWGGFSVVALLAAVSVVVIVNTIQLTVFARRREISIMKYVGATNAFIRLPFFVEGMAVGVIAGLLSGGAVCLGYYFVYDFLQGMYNMWVLGIVGSFLKLSDIAFKVVLYAMAGGMLLGGLGTVFSVRKHLKV